jgi:hypothetical protein
MTFATDTVLPVSSSWTFTSGLSGRADQGPGGFRASRPRSHLSSVAMPTDPDRFGVDLRETLDAFLAGRDVGHGPRDEIGASWRRAAASGLRPDHVDCPSIPIWTAKGCSSGPLVR